jgi:Fe-S oxidoreductase
MIQRMPSEYSRYFGEVPLSQGLTTTPEDVTWRVAPPGRTPEHHDIVLYLGCNVFRTSHLARTVTAVFDRLGLDYVAVGGPAYCCGIVHQQTGDTPSADGMARRSVEHLAAWSPREVVMWCPSCIYFYDELKQLRLPFAFRHTSEFLVEQLPRVEFTHEVRERVALHAHAVGEARVREGRAARQLLAAVPGLEVAGLEPDARFGRSCTAAVQQQLGIETWNAAVRDELARAGAAGAGTLATMYHGCQRLLCAFEAEQPLRVEHYLTVFARGLGIEIEDVYKKYRLWGDPARVMEDAAPCQQANGLDPERAREFVTLAFGQGPGAPARDALPPGRVAPSAHP